jgi:hypothetical protein
MSRIESFLDLYNSESTINAYKSTLKKYFFFFHEGTKKEFSIKEAEEKYFSEERARAPMVVTRSSLPRIPSQPCFISNMAG